MYSGGFLKTEINRMRLAVAGQLRLDIPDFRQNEKAVVSMVCFRAVRWKR
jgi:hypothetical protein